MEKTIALNFSSRMRPRRLRAPRLRKTPETGRNQRQFFSNSALALVDVAHRQTSPNHSPPTCTSTNMPGPPDGQKHRRYYPPPRGNGDSNWYIAELFHDQRGQRRDEIHLQNRRCKSRGPVWALDGKNHCPSSQVLMSDESSVGGDIFVIPATGGTPKNLTREKRSSASWLAWTKKSKKLFFCRSSRRRFGCCFRLTLQREKFKNFIKAASPFRAGLWGAKSFASLADGENLLAVEISRLLTRPARNLDRQKLVAGRNSALANKDVKPAWGQVKSIHWKSDEYDVQGWLVYPRDFDPAKKYPLVVNVHGGPGAAVQSSLARHRKFCDGAPVGRLFCVIFPIRAAASVRVKPSRVPT